MDDTLAAYLALRHNCALPDHQFSQLMCRYGTVKALLAAPENNHLAEFVARPDEACRRKMDQEFNWAEQPKNHLLIYESPDYPPQLREIDYPPSVLAVRGRPTLHSPQIALVGSRNCSAYGKRTAFWLAKELVALGLTVTSGLALGIDTASHEGALQALQAGLQTAIATTEDATESPATVAVVANGLDTVYPRRNDKLTASIIERGAVVSEFTLGCRPLAGYFPRRNRIISGLSHGVVVVEAAMRSGSLITARLAMEQNREVFAVPGSVHTASSEGCHWLIKNGAKLIDGPADILTELNSTTLSLLRSESRKLPQGQESDNPVTDPQCLKLLKLMRGEELLFDELKERSKLQTDSLTATLLQLEILGRIEIHAGRIHPV